jgi:transglutaminase-like putative cysteine protease
MKEFLSPTFYIDSDHPGIVDFARNHSGGERSPVESAVSLYYAVRDKIRYNPYAISPNKADMKASAVLALKEGYCVAKAVLLAACLRSIGIPARLGFADVKNHLTTGRLRERMGTDVFIWHGYTDIYLEGQWVKATPAFNLSLCETFGVKPLEFDGRTDSVFHPFDMDGNRHMEYLKDYGRFADLPWERIAADFMAAYPDYLDGADLKTEDFTAQAESELGPKTV